MLKRIATVSLITMVVFWLAGAGWAAVTLDEVARGLAEVKIEISGLKSDIGWLKVVGTSFFAAIVALLAGLFYFVFDISRSLRIPREERVAKLEKVYEDLRESFVKLKDYLGQVGEKLHLPKPIL